jgi:hypothetical protein
MKPCSFKAHPGYDPIQPVLTEDLLSNSEEWGNVKDVIKVCIKSLTETLKIQGNTIREIERNVSNRVFISDFHASLAKKSDFIQTSGTIADLKNKLDDKVSYFDLESIISARVGQSNSAFCTNSIKSLDSRINVIENLLSSKAESKSVFALIDTFQKELEKMKGFQTHSNTLLARNIEDIDKNKAGKEEVKEILIKLNQRIQNKLDSSELEKILEKNNKNSLELILSLKSEFKSKLDHLKTEFLSKVPEKPKLPLIENYEISKENFPGPNTQSEFNPAPSVPRKKLPKHEYDCSIQRILKKVEEIEKELLLKASIKDICTLLDMKANIEDINTALSDIHKELDTKLSLNS